MYMHNIMMSHDHSMWHILFSRWGYFTSPIIDQYPHQKINQHFNHVSHVDYVGLEAK